MAERGKSLTEINTRLADFLVNINGDLEYPRAFALKRLLIDQPTNPPDIAACAGMVTAPAKSKVHNVFAFDPASTVRKKK